MSTLAIDQQPNMFSAAPGSDQGTVVFLNETTPGGFFGATPIPRPVIPASPSAAQIAAVLVALGLASQGA